MVSGCSFAGNSAGTGGSGGAGSWYGAGFGGHGGNGGAICSGETSIRVSKSGFAGSNAGAGGTGGAGGVERPEQYAGGEGSAGGGGGAILVTEGSLEVSEASFTDNRAGPGGKGGECCYQEGEQSVGEAGHSGGDGGDGGAVVVAGGTLEATGCRFTGNRAGYGGSATGGWIGGFGGNGGSGGSIFVLGDTRLVGCLIAGGQAGDAGGTTADYPGGHGGLGGGVYSAHGDTVIVGCTITGQGLGGSATSGGYGSALSCSGSSNLVVGSIVYGNKTQPQWPSGEESPQISCDETLDLRHSIVHPEDLDAYGGTGVLTKDPRFVNAAHGDFRLRPDSPCVDTGETAALPTDTADLDGDGDTSEQLPIDLAGAPRVTGEAVDMGAYEYWIGCGNGVVERGEGCDDSNTLDGDRCSANCACESPGAGLGCPVASCAALAGEPGLDDGGYWLSPDVSGEPFKAYCDLSTAGGGWTMVLRLNSNDDHSRGYHSDLFWTYGGEGAAHPYRHRPTGLDDDEDYRAPAYDFLEGWSEILLDYRYAEGQAKRMAAVFSGTSHGSFWSHANQDPRNDNPAWARTFTLSEGEQADAAGWYGPVLKFQTVGDGDDRFIIWFNQAPVDACNQTGGIGVHGRAGDLWWSHELSFPSAMPGCQEDTHRGRIGSNGQPWSGSSLMGEELLSPADAYEHGIMTVLVR